MEAALLEQGEERKLKNWKHRVSRINELMNDCEDKLANVKSKGDPKNRKEAEEQIISANVRFHFSVDSFLFVLFYALYPNACETFI